MSAEVNMRCSKCGADNRETAKFCDGCGSPIQSQCASCGALNRPGARFCDGCGTALSGGKPTFASATTKNPATNNLAREPRAYTPKHLADKILTSRAVLEGERKQVTVLFADVKGSRELR